MTTTVATEHFSDREVADHERMFRFFVRFIVWNIAAIAVVLVFLAAWAG